MLRFFAREPRLLLRIDGGGALATALSLLAVASRSRQLFGLPDSLLLGLSGFAFVIAVLSLAFGTVLSRHARLWLGKVCVVNALYCLITAALLCRYSGQATALGLAYFLGEIAIIAALVVVEVKALRA